MTNGIFPAIPTLQNTRESFAERTGGKILAGGGMLLDCLLSVVLGSVAARGIRCSELLHSKAECQQTV